MPKALKSIFLVHAVVSVVFGVWLYLAPGSFATLVNWTPFDAQMTRLFGALLLALAFSSWLAYQAATYESVRIIVQMEIALTALATVGGLYSALITISPLSIWAAIAIFAAFAIAWISGYNLAEKTMKTEKDTSVRIEEKL
ncbi:MAG: hypothetical protein HKM93_02005 [Desulfobacteraceae bacterium]|nr:hypothetical protein [Desulfobacteraceae bacterium]